MLPQNILSQTSRHNDRDYRLPRTETHSSSTPVQHPIKTVVHPSTTPSSVPPSPFSLQSDHQPKKSFDANGASSLSKLPTPTSSIASQKTERKSLSGKNVFGFSMLLRQMTIEYTTFRAVACLLYAEELRFTLTMNFKPTAPAHIFGCHLMTCVAIFIFFDMTFSVIYSFFYIWKVCLNIKLLQAFSGKHKWYNWLVWHICVISIPTQPLWSHCVKSSWHLALKL